MHRVFFLQDKMNKALDGAGVPVRTKQDFIKLYEATREVIILNALLQRK